MIVFSRNPDERKSEVDFWQRVYLAYMQSEVPMMGSDGNALSVEDVADGAVTSFRKRMPKPREPIGDDFPNRYERVKST